jgi:hypothetical protein
MGFLLSRMRGHGALPFNAGAEGTVPTGAAPRMDGTLTQIKAAPRPT